jgi:predicted Rossmann fold flavoprotein
MAEIDIGICIVGAGPAGLMATIHAAGASPCVVEANAAAGLKLLLTGGGRCNFTHADGPEELAKAFGKAGRFLRHGLYEFPPDAVREFFRSRGLADTVEPDGCVFPARGRATNIRDIVVDEARKLGAQFRYQWRVKDIVTETRGFRIETEGRPLLAARMIVATGGLSWPQTGSRGDGYRFAAQLGHTVIPPQAALVPLITRETWPQELAGVSLPDVRMWAAVGRRRLVTAGHMLFTQNGIGGPAVLDLSRLLADELSGQSTGIAVEIDVLPGRNESQLAHWLQAECRSSPRKTMVNILSGLVPRQFARTVCCLAQSESDLQAGQLSTDKRRRLVGVLKKVPLYVTGTEPIAKATVTHGGVSRDEIDPRTMESKIRPGLFFAGEVIDLDGPCGGYNLQMCWSTGVLAGRSAARSLLNRETAT